MAAFQTKHQRNSAKITTLVALIVALLLFVVGPNYLEEPEEYGVAINFGEGNFTPNVNPNNTPLNEETFEEDIQDIEDIEETLDDFEDVEEDVSEDDSVEEEIPEEDVAEEETKEEEAAKEKLAKEQAEKELLEQQEAEAERLKAEEEAKKRAEEAKKKAEKEKADREAKEKAARQAKADAERRAREAKEAKARADKAKRATAAREAAEARKKAAQAGAEANKKNSSGGSTKGFNLSQEGPIYPGCEGLDNKARKACMSSKVAQFVKKNFNYSIAENLGLTGDQSIKIAFKIDETGRIVGIRTITNHPKLDEETKRVIKMLPKLTPAKNQGKAKSVNFSVPIKLQIKD